MVYNSGVYCIKNIETGKVYIGSSNDIAYRKVHHFSELRCGRHANSYLQHAFEKYGEQSFEFYLIEQAAVPDLIAREQYWLGYFNATDRDYGYNISPFADRPTPWINKKHHSEETKLRMSVTKKGKVFTAQHRKNLSIAHKGQVSNWKGKKFTGEQIEKIKAGLQRRFPNGRPSPMTGRKLSAETIQKRTASRRRNKNGQY